MERKAKIIKTIDINEDYAVLIVKKNKEKPKFCKDCPHFKYFGDLSIHYCEKHKGVVEPTDFCIEVGM